MFQPHRVKVERLLLENYLPLFLTTGLNRIEIDWRDTQEMLTLIVGMNGSGKTVLLTELTPDINEGVMHRSKNSLKIIPGTDGLKELDLLVDDSIRYRCRVLQPDKGPTKASFEKEIIATGEKVELNPNGNVSTYMDALESELGFDKNYINIGYLTDGITNVIGMKPTERNTYISTWLPAITDYLEAHKITAKNRGIIKRQLDMVNADIGRILSVDYEIELQNLTSTIQDLEIQWESIQNNITRGETFLSMLNPQQAREIKMETQLLSARARDMKATRDTIDVVRSSMEKYAGEAGRDRLNRDKSKLNTDLQLNKQKLNALDESLVSLRARIQEYQSSLSVSVSESLPDITDAIHHIDKTIDETKRLIATYESDHPQFKDQASVEVSQKVHNIIDTIRLYWTRIQENVETDLLRANTISLATKRIDDSLGVLQREEALLLQERDDVSRRIYALQHSGIDARLLEKKPSHCTPAACPLLRELMILASPEKEIASLQKSLSELNEKIQKRMEERSTFEERRITIAEAIKLMGEVNHIVYEYRDTIGQLPEGLRNIINRDTGELLNDFAQTQQLFNAYKEYSSLVTSLQIHEEKRSVLLNKQQMVVIKMQNDAESRKAMDEFTQSMAKRQGIVSEVERCERELTTLHSLQSQAQSLAQNIQTFNQDAIQLHTQRRVTVKKATEWYYRSHLEDILMKLRNDRNTIRSQLDAARIKRETLQSKLLTRQTLEERRDELMQKMRTYELFEKIWSPKIGYPALRIKDFLYTIQEKTNTDLARMWNGELQIQEFDMTDGEFAIRVLRGGNTIIDDASLCSDGERATLALAISLAILEVHVEKNTYNVIRLDEVDAKLDETRRRGFLSMITDRLKEINCASCFAVTHNNEFDLVPANLIIMPGYDVSTANLSNKNIVFSAL